MATKQTMQENEILVNRKVLQYTNTNILIIRKRNFQKIKSKNIPIFDLHFEKVKTYQQQITRG